MTPEFKNRWIEALRSGRYEQGRSLLRQDLPSGAKRHCCLGVAADLIDPEGWRDWGHKLSNNVELTDELARAIGIGSYKMKELAKLNDGGCTFARIADEIEALPIDG